MTSKVKFYATDEELALIGEIVHRAQSMVDDPTMIDELSLRMDLLATHANGNPLDFQKLLAAPPLSFAHDIYGIAAHLDRSTGQLRDHFSPRCSAPEPAEV